LASKGVVNVYDVKDMDFQEVMFYHSKLKESK